MSDPMDQVWDATPIGMPKLDAHILAMEKARSTLIAVLVKQFMDDLHSDGAYGPEVARRGHAGYIYRSNQELIQEALDMGHDCAVNVREAIEFLEAWTPNR